MGIGGASQASLGSGSVGIAGVLGGDNSPPRLKASTNNANGGVGVTYSNVVLAGGLNPRDHSTNNFVSN